MTEVKTQADRHTVNKDNIELRIGEKEVKWDSKTKRQNVNTEEEEEEQRI